MASNNQKFKGYQEQLFVASHMDNQSKQDEYQGQQAMTQDLKQKFDQMTKEINQMPKNPDLFKNHQLPLARIKKIMKSDEDVRMISSQTPVLFAKACEIFIIELTHRAWKFTQQAKRRTLQKSDIAACIQKTEIFDFLIDLIPRQDQQKQVKKIQGVQTQQGIQWNYSQQGKFK